MKRPPIFRPLTRQEQTLVRYFVREGGLDAHLGRAARRAKVDPQKAEAILRRPHVQAELAERLALLHYEQAKLDARDINAREQQEEEQVRVTEEKVYRQLNQLVEMPVKDLTEKHEIKARIVKLALVVTGTIRDGRTERLTPLDAPQGHGGPNIYKSIFQREAPPALPAPLYPEAAAPGAPTLPQDAPPPATSQTPSRPAAAAQRPKEFPGSPPESASPSGVLDVPVRKRNITGS